MSSPDGAFRRMVLRIKPGADTPPKQLPRKLFLGVRFRGSSAVLRPLTRTEDQK